MHLPSENTPQTHDIGPWYKQPWLWFILAPLIAVFFYGTSYAYLSVVTFDGMVKDDYEKTAKHFNLASSRLDRAAAMELKAQINLDTLTGDIRLVLSSTPVVDSLTLLLDIVHPTMASLDQPISMARRPDGSYYGSVNKTINGKRYLHITGPDNTWRLSSEVNSPWPNNIIIIAQ